MARDVTFDDKDLKRFERDLKRAAREALPFANRGALNDGAVMGRQVAQKTIGKKLIIRNKWTQGSIGFKKAKQKRIRDQRAFVGSRQPYMETTEFGGVKRSKKKHGVPLATREASNEGRGSDPRQKLPIWTNRIKVMELERAKLNSNPKKRKQKNLILILTAARRGGKHVILRGRKGLGVYRVKGRPIRRKHKSDTGAKVKSVKMVWDLSQKTVTVPPTPWLGPTAVVMRKRMPGIYRKNLKKQLIRRRIFKR